jgi:hypothetical protein
MLATPLQFRSAKTVGRKSNVGRRATSTNGETRPLQSTNTRERIVLKFIESALAAERRMQYDLWRAYVEAAN